MRIILAIAECIFAVVCGVVTLVAASAVAVACVWLMCVTGYLVLQYLNTLLQ